MFAAIRSPCTGVGYPLLGYRLDFGLLALPFKRGFQPAVEVCCDIPRDLLATSAVWYLDGSPNEFSGFSRPGSAINCCHGPWFRFLTVRSLSVQSYSAALTSSARLLFLLLDSVFESLRSPFDRVPDISYHSVSFLKHRLHSFSRRGENRRAVSRAISLRKSFLIGVLGGARSVMHWHLGLTIRLSYGVIPVMSFFGFGLTRTFRSLKLRWSGFVYCSGLGRNLSIGW